MAQRRGDADAPKAGFYGKAPSHGDFVSNRFDRALRDRLDPWLQRAISDSRRRLEDGWEEAFAGMPVWRFALGAEVAGGKPVIGVMAPSRDRVGREFPLVLALRVAGHDGSTRALCGCKAWFDAAESLIREAADEDLDLDRFDEMVERLPGPEIAPLGDEDRKPDRDRSFWWSEDPVAGAARFASVDLPAPSEFHRLLAIQPDEARQARPAPTPAPAPAAPRRPELEVAIESAAASNPGARIRINADVWMSLPHVHAVADGVGDLPSAAGAARAAIAPLEAIAPAETVEALVRRVRSALGAAHAALRGGAAEGEERPCASIAALCFAGSDFAAMWAGDVRCYLVRDGLMRRLTHDHVEVGLVRRRLTRSVGGLGPPTYDAAVERLGPDDRFLICTRHLVLTLDERAIADAILSGSPQEVADRLVQDAVISGVRGNVTAVVLHARAIR